MATAVSLARPVLHALVARLAELEQRVAALEHQARPRTPERDAQLLSAIASTLGGEVFSAGDLRQRAEQHPELAEAIAGADVRRIGLWLRRLARRPVAGYILHRVKREHRGRLWCVSITPSAPSVSTCPPARSRL